MRELIAITLLLISNAASAEEWVFVRKPSDPGQAGTPAILVDSTSIEILATGIRRARSKTDFLAPRANVEKFGPRTVVFIIWVNSYDCEKQMTHEDSLESHLIDGSALAHDFPKDTRWYPAPANPAADPTIDFVCGWKPK